MDITYYHQVPHNLYLAAERGHLSTIELATIQALLSWCGNGKRFNYYGSVKTLGSRAGLSERSTHRVLKKLESKNFFIKPSEKLPGHTVKYYVGSVKEINKWVIDTFNIEVDVDDNDIERGRENVSSINIALMKARGQL